MCRSRWEHKVARVADDAARASAVLRWASAGKRSSVINTDDPLPMSARKDVGRSLPGRPAHAACRRRKAFMASMHMLRHTNRRDSRQPVVRLGRGQPIEEIKVVAIPQLPYGSMVEVWLARK